MKFVIVTAFQESVILFGKSSVYKFRLSCLDPPAGITLVLVYVETRIAERHLNWAAKGRFF